MFATDSGSAPLRSELDSLGIPYEAGGHTAERFLEAEEIVMSPGVPLDIPPLEAARRKGIPIVSEIEVAFRYLQGEIVAITGSNGKTTTTTLVGEVLNTTGRPVQVGGNIGTAMSSLVDSSRPTTINVVEVSSFQLDGIRKFRPRVAVLNANVVPDHLDRYADFKAYRASKFRIFENQILRISPFGIETMPKCIRPLPPDWPGSGFSASASRSKTGHTVPVELCI